MSPCVSDTRLLMGAGNWVARCKIQIPLALWCWSFVAVVGLALAPADSELGFVLLLRFPWGCVWWPGCFVRTEVHCTCV